MIRKHFTPYVAVFAAAFIAGTGAAHATGYSVVATSTTHAGTIYDNGGAQCTYNNSSVGGRCSGGGSTPTSYSATVTPIGGDGSARVVTASTSGTGGGGSAQSTVTADLKTASLHLYAADSDRTGNCSSGTVPCGYAQASGTLNDTLHFTVAGATAMTITTVQARFTLEGSMIHTGSTVDTPDSGYAEIYGTLHFGGTPSRFDLISDSTSGYATRASLDNYPSGISPSTWTTNAAHTSNVSNFTFTLNGASGDANFYLDASLLCDRGYTCDFSNTAKFALILPAGVSFTSDSGVFLAGGAPVGGVPEPASWALMVAGFGIVGTAARRRRRVLAA